jgi:hypothetical protein
VLPRIGWKRFREATLLFRTSCWWRLGGSERSEPGFCVVIGGGSFRNSTLLPFGAAPRAHRGHRPRCFSSVAVARCCRPSVRPRHTRELTFLCRDTPGNYLSSSETHQGTTPCQAETHQGTTFCFLCVCCCEPENYRKIFDNFLCGPGCFC